MLHAKDRIKYLRAEACHILHKMISPIPELSFKHSVQVRCANEIMKLGKLPKQYDLIGPSVSWIQWSGHKIDVGVIGIMKLYCILNHSTK